MGPLPDDFATLLASVLATGDEEAAARVVQSAVALDDGRLATFLDLFAERVRSSGEPVTGAELRTLLERARGAPPGAA